jgi:hypothetical protein
MKFLSSINVNTEYTLPITDGAVGQALLTDGSGNAYWGTISTAVALNDLTDVTLTSPVISQLLRYNGSQWVNWTPNFLVSESDTLATVVSRGSSTVNAITVGGLNVNGNTTITGTLVVPKIEKNGSQIINSIEQSEFEGQVLKILSIQWLGTEIAKVESNGKITAGSFVKYGGTSSQFLKADGSVDSNTYLTSYTETDTLDSVTDRGNTTINPITVGGLTSGSVTTSLVESSGLLIIDADKSGGLQPDQGDPAVHILDFTWQGQTQGYIDTDGKITFNGFKTPTGLSTQFLKADGSVDSSTYATQTWVGQNYATIDYVDDEISGVNTYVSTYFVPKTRTITINGTAYDLSADRAWTINTAETDTLDSVTDRGNTTTNTIMVGGVTSNYVILSTASSDVTAQGTLKWGPDHNTVELYYAEDQHIDIGQTHVWYVKNTSDTVITRGMVVMATGAVGNSGNIEVQPLVANGSISGKYAIGIVKNDIQSGEFGYVITEGTLRGIDTSQYQIGTTLYADPINPGGLTSVEPVAPNLKLPVAFVLSSANNGAIGIRMTQGLDLAEIHDVTISSASNGQLLRYNNNVWSNWTPNYLTSANLSGYATESYVTTAIANLVDSAPGTLDTLNELAAALGDDPNFATTVTNSIATKATYFSSRFQGNLNTLGISNASSGIYSIGAGYTNGPGSTTLYGTLYTFWNDDISVQIWPTYNGDFYWRKSVGASFTGSTWRTIWDTSHFVQSDINNWNAAYNDRITAAAVSGTTTKTLTLTQGDGGTVVATWTDYDTNDQELSWDLATQILSISGGNEVDLRDLASQDFVTSQGYLTSYTETDTLATVVSRGSVTLNPISVAQTTGGGFLYRTDSSWGNWARNGFSFANGSGTVMKSLGAYGDNGTSLGYMYLGNDYLDNNFRIYSGHVYVPGLDLAISNTNSTHGTGTYFRGDSAHFVFGLNNGNTLYLNYGNDGGTLRSFGTQYHSGSLVVGGTAVYTTGGNATLSVVGNVISFGASNGDLSYLRRLDAGQFQWQTYNSGNTGQIHLQPYGGEVGIGTTNPIYKLDIAGAVRLTGSLVFDDLTSNLIQHRAGTDVNTLVTVGHGGFDHNGYLRIGGADVATQDWVQSQGYITEYTETDTLQSVTSRGASTNADISIGGAGGDRGLVINHGAGVNDYGRIRFYQDGVNTQTIHAFSSAWQSGTVFNASSDAININGRSGVTFGSWSAPDAVIVTGGISYFRNNVGIGITNPTSKLQVDGNIDATGVISQTFWTNDSIRKLNANASLNFRTAAGPIEMVLDGSGNLVVGGISPNPSNGAKIFGLKSESGKYFTQNAFGQDGGYTWPSTTYVTGNDNSPVGNTTFRGNGAFQGHVTADYVPIDATKTYKVSVWMRAVSGSPFCYLSHRQYYWDYSNGNPTNGGWGNPYWFSGTPSSSWTEYSMTIGPAGSGADYTHMAGVKFIRHGWLHNYTADGSATAEFQGWKVEELDSILANNVTVMGSAVATQSWVQSQNYLTSETDSQTLSWDKPSITLSISNGNSIELGGLATEDFVTSQGYLTSLPAHNHDDRYYTETESDARYLYYRGYSTSGDTQTFQSTPNTLRFDQVGDLSGAWSNEPTGYYTYGGILSLRGANFALQIYGSHTGDLAFKTQWENDQYSGWRTIITSANIGSQSVAYATSAGNADTVDGLHASSFLRSDVVDANVSGTILSTNNANVDGANFEVNTTNKSVNEYAYKVSRSGSAVGGIYIDGRGEFPSVAVGGAAITSTTVSNWNTAYGWGNHATAGYLTSETDSQTLSWEAGSKNLTISNGNTVTLDGLASEEYVTSQGYITGYSETDTLASVVSRGNSTSGSIVVGGNITVSSNNTTGGGIILADDGDIVDLNDAYCSMRFTSGVRIFSANRGGSAVITLGSNGVVSASGGNSSNWNTAYSWGNHADYGYWNINDADTKSVQSSSVRFAGDVEVQGTFTESSSIRFKENIKPLEPALGKVEQLNPVTYNKIGSEDEEIGLIAEEVAELFPEVVTYNEDGSPQGIQYQRLSVILLKAVQELTERVNKLENK